MLTPTDLANLRAYLATLPDAPRYTLTVRPALVSATPPRLAVPRALAERPTPTRWRIGGQRVLASYCSSRLAQDVAAYLSRLTGRTYEAVAVGGRAYRRAVAK